MEELFSLLPTIVIFVFIFKRLSGVFEKVAEKHREMDDEDLIYERAETVAGPEYNVDTVDTENKEKEMIKAENPVSRKQTAEKKEFKPVTNTRKEIGKNINGKTKNAGKSLFPDNRLNQEDILRGFVFKQILSEPRAKRKWRPANRN